MNKSYSLLLLALFGLSNLANAQNVSIPDANFKNYLVNNPEVNSDFNSEISFLEAAAFAGTIDLTGVSVFSLTGIEAFTALTSLICINSDISSLNLTANTALTSLQCFGNNITSLNLSSNSVLSILRCDYNQLTSLTLPNTTTLTYFTCSNNSLTNLDLSTYTTLTQLRCDNNELTSLSLPSTTTLTYLWCNENSLTSLNVSANTALISLGCGNNSLASLNVSTNTALTELGCGNNSLTSLNVSANTALTNFVCGGNSLTSLNLKNGNNNNIIEFSATNCPNLFCIEVDDAVWATNNWTVANTNIDTWQSFSENCSTGITEFINNKFSTFPNPAVTELTITGLTSKAIATIMDATGRVVLSTEVINNKVDVSSIAQGIYYMHLQTNEGTITRKIEIAK